MLVFRLHTLKALIWRQLLVRCFPRQCLKDSSSESKGIFRSSPCLTRGLCHSLANRTATQAVAAVMGEHIILLFCSVKLPNCFFGFGMIDIN